MFIKLNTNTLYVNFNKRKYTKREHVTIQIILIGGLIKTKQKPIYI